MSRRTVKAKCEANDARMRGGKWWGWCYFIYNSFQHSTFAADSSSIVASAIFAPFFVLRCASNGAFSYRSHRMLARIVLKANVFSGGFTVSR
eukprot:3694199-Rhodomonas_salina.2